MSVTLEDRPLHPLPWQNLQRLARYCMIHYISRKAHGSPSSAPQRLAPASKFVATLHQVDIWRRTWIHILLRLRYHGRPRQSIHIFKLEELRLPFTSSMSWHLQPFSNADVDIPETTQGNNFDLQPTTQHVLFRSRAHWRWLICHDANLGTATKIQATIFDCCRVFEGTKQSPSIKECHLDNVYFLRSSSSRHGPRSHLTDSTRSWNTSTLHS